MKEDFPNAVVSEQTGVKPKKNHVFRIGAYA